MTDIALLVWAIGIWITVSLGIFGHLYTMIVRVEKDMQKLVSTEIARFGEKMEELHREIAGDRKETATNRVLLAEKMVSKEELHAMEGRILHEIEVRFPRRVRSE